MKYAILGDVHANFDALNIVVQHALSQGVEIFTCVGDVVGYGPEPGLCISLLKELKARVVAGNHDWAVLGKLDVATFNPIARESVFWTKSRLTQDELDYLEALPLTYETEHFIVTHGTLHEPEKFFYLQSFQEAALSFQELSSSQHYLCVCGHSHVPVNFFLRGAEIEFDQDSFVKVDPSVKTLVNVGSVGQPRDRNNQTGYALYDSDLNSLQLHRLDYDIDNVIGKIISAGLPEYNGNRLLLGM